MNRFKVAIVGDSSAADLFNHLCGELGVQAAWGLHTHTIATLLSSTQLLISFSVAE